MRLSTGSHAAVLSFFFAFCFFVLVTSLFSIVLLTLLLFLSPIPFLSLSLSPHVRSGYLHTRTTHTYNTQQSIYTACIALYKYKHFHVLALALARSRAPSLAAAFELLDSNDDDVNVS